MTIRKIHPTNKNPFLITQLKTLFIKVSILCITNQSNEEKAHPLFISKVVLSVEWVSLSRSEAVEAKVKAVEAMKRANYH